MKPASQPFGYAIGTRARSLRVTANTEAVAAVLAPPDRRIRSRPNRTSPDELGAAPEQSIFRARQMSLPLPVGGGIDPPSHETQCPRAAHNAWPARGRSSACESQTYTARRSTPHN